MAYDCPPDWVKTLRRASYRGASFFVQGDDIQYGRRIKVHEFPNRDRPYPEDLGEKAIEVSVTAYVASDTVIADKDRLVKACRQRGAGTLVLPTEGSMKMLAYHCARKHDKDKLGYIAFELKFHEAGQEFGTFTAALLDRLVSVAGGFAISALPLDLMRAFNTASEPTWVLSAATEGLQNWLGQVDEIRISSLGASKAAASELAADLTTAYRNARSLVHLGRGLRAGNGASFEIVPGVRGAADRTSASASPISPVSANGSTAAGDVPALVTAVAEIVGGVRLAAPSTDVAIEALSALAAYDMTTFAAGEGVSTTGAVERGNEEAMNSLFRRTALVELAIAASGARYSDRGSAIWARAAVSELFEREIATAGPQVFPRLDEVRSRAALAMSRQIADLRPAITVEANAALPSLLWAWRLYGDPARGAAMASRNHVRHPAFMPEAFEAEAP